MSTGRGQRKLAAILAADVVGYSRLMAEDDRATVEALKEAREVFRERIVAHGGRLVDTAGDSVLAEFPSDVEAVEAAVEVQARLAKINAPMPEARRMAFRIGVNTGDVIAEADGTLYGDGVNVAARLEGLAEPGGINISARVHDDVEGKVDVVFVDIGEHEVKNIARPVRAYRVVAAGEAVPSPAKPQSRFLPWRTATVATVVILAVVLWQTVGIPTSEPEPAPEPADPILAMPTGPSIAVLPFNNLTGDPSQEFFADGVTEEIITGLSRFSNLKVLARNTTFQFKGEAVDVAEIGQRLGVDYLVEGSVQRDATTVRVTAQLLDAREGDHVWAERYERELLAESLFAVQDDITSQIITRIGDIHGAVSRANIQAMHHRDDVAIRDYDCILLTHEYQRFLTPDKHGAVKTCLQETVERNPTYAEAWANLAYTYVDQYWTGYDGPDKPLQLALTAARKAVELDANSQMAHFALANVYYFLDEVDSFIIEAEKALQLNPNNTEVIAAIGVRFTYAEQRERGVALIEKATRLNPAHPGWYWYPVAYDYLRQRDYETALAYAKRVDMPGFWPYYSWLASIYGHLGDEDRARAAVAELNSLNPSYKDDPRPFLNIWFKAEEGVEQIMEGLEKAGLFDEPEPPSRPVIAVLPFDNLSGDPEQEYFSDGITEDLISRLSKFDHLGVIARNSTFQFKGRALDVREIGVDLGANYVLEGSVRKAGSAVRVTAQLIDANDGTHVWTDNFDRDISADNIFSIQDEITNQVAARIADVNGVLMREVARDREARHPSSVNAYDCLYRVYEYARFLSREGHLVSLECLEAATEVEENFADGLAWLAYLHVDTHWYGWNQRAEGPNPIELAALTAQRALQVDPSNQMAQFISAVVLFIQGDLDGYVEAVETAIALNPNNAQLLGDAGMYMFWAAVKSDKRQRGLAWISDGMALNPYHPGYYYVPFFYDRYFNKDYEAALDFALKIKEPGNHYAHLAATIAYAQLGMLDEATAALQELLRTYPDYQDHAYADLDAWHIPHDYLEHMLDGVRKAGLDVPQRAASQD